jgi:hypothetical protein
MTAEMAFDPFTLPPSFAMASLRQRADLGVYGSCLPAAHCRAKMRTLFPSESKRPVCVSSPVSVYYFKLNAVLVYNIYPQYMYILP